VRNHRRSADRVPDGEFPTVAYAILVIAITAVAITDRADRGWGTHDSQRIVIDEVGAIVMWPVNDFGALDAVARL
jgi:phosphatidylglycerophosphatase A